MTLLIERDSFPPPVYHFFFSDEMCALNSLGACRMRTSSFQVGLRNLSLFLGFSASRLTGRRPRQPGDQTANQPDNRRPWLGYPARFHYYSDYLTDCRSVIADSWTRSPLAAASERSRATAERICAAAGMVLPLFFLPSVNVCLITPLTLDAVDN